MTEKKKKLLTFTFVLVCLFVFFVFFFVNVVNDTIRQSLLSRYWHCCMSF